MTDFDMAITASWQSAAARDARLGVFATARRHTRVVRVLRVLLPLLGVGIVAGFAVATQLRLPAGLDLDAARLSVTRNSIIMDRPHLTGFDRNHREYSVAATRAIQPFSNPGQVRLEDLEAKIESATGTVTTITAEVVVGYGDSQVSGKRLSVGEGGKVIVLEGDVKTILMPPKRAAAAAPTPQPGTE
jgi:lipopolysaccharide export system protein LptC